MSLTTSLNSLCAVHYAQHELSMRLCITNSAHVYSLVTSSSIRVRTAFNWQSCCCSSHRKRSPMSLINTFDVLPAEMYELHRSTSEEIRRRKVRTANDYVHQRWRKAVQGTRRDRYANHADMRTQTTRRRRKRFRCLGYAEFGFACVCHFWLRFRALIPCSLDY